MFNSIRSRHVRAGRGRAGWDVVKLEHFRLYDECPGCLGRCHSVRGEVIRGWARRGDGSREGE